MYSKPFFIEKPVGNNAFSFEKRQNKKLFVPNIIAGTIDDIKKGVEVVFEDCDYNGILQSGVGLRNFYEIEWMGKKIILFDNHNHAFYFWYLARQSSIIGNNNILFHIDEHSDMREPNEYLGESDFGDLQKVFEYTNFSLNVGNYIVPAIKEGIIGEVIQIRNRTNLENYLRNINIYDKDIILNLDLDFFQPELDYIDYGLKKQVILDIAKKAKFITVASSPNFISQDLAIKVFRDLFDF